MLRWVVAGKKSYRKDLVSGRCREFDQFSLRTRYVGCRQQRMIQRQQACRSARAPTGRCKRRQQWFKRWHVSEIGFSGILKLPVLQKLSLKFSAWTMNKAYVQRCVICINENNILRFWATDIHKVFIAPCGNRDVKANITEDQSILSRARSAWTKQGLTAYVQPKNL
ncbi:uncharacterized protein LOC124693595 [Lolium rigidum]|uniref:uncharacterized protein LOC124693595 n=1 Tax=Lolium rigidum TaxID=89674 RepID=UPI001F5C2152|nr:uncharacterized protein LOC124693595 [Lolium rigidum]